ncbi:hypothetical protein ACTID9_20455 [Brevibacillus fluminis]|uniref:hypothetical protein n=1 Tax=Brevibacillus fluminis TaxID=511487 RepID=UPI003F89A6E4
MGFVRVLGWIFVPYIMILFRWKLLNTAKRVFAIPWALVALFMGIGIVTSSGQDTKPTMAVSSPVSNEPKVDDQATKAAEEQAKKKAEEEAKAKVDAEKKAKEEAEKKAKQAEQKSGTKVANTFQNVIPQLAEGHEMESTTYQYIVDHYAMFPANNDKDIQLATSKVDLSITPKHLTKNIQPYLDKMVKFTGQVISVEETKLDDGIVTYIHILTQEGDNITGVYLKTTGDLLDGDYATITGVPTLNYSFPNVSGGHTNAIMLSAAHIQKEIQAQ